MKHWPMSLIASTVNRLCVPNAVYVDEHGAPTQAFLEVCFAACGCTLPLDSPNAAAGVNGKRQFIGHPSYREWNELERMGVYDYGGQLVLVIDAIH